MSDQSTTITEIIALAETEGLDVYKGADVVGYPDQGRYEVHFDYGDANVSYWGSREEARQEAGRLWVEGRASQIKDLIVEAAGYRVSARSDEVDRRMIAAAEQIRADLRAA